MDVLLVDDHPGMRRVLRSVLDDLPDVFVVAEATSGEEGVELAARLRPDLVIMDWSMPGMNGVEATQRLRESAPDVEVVAYTSTAERGVAEAFASAGASESFVKPELDPLIDFVERRARGGG